MEDRSINTCITECPGGTFARFYGIDMSVGQYMTYDRLMESLSTVQSHTKGDNIPCLHRKEKVKMENINSETDSLVLRFETLLDYHIFMQRTKEFMSWYFSLYITQL